MKRIAIIGSTGSGKSTLAGQLAEKLALFRIELDEYYHMPGWQVREPAELQHMVEDATSREAWVSAGNYSKLNDLVWSRADTIIWLDYSFPLTFRRLWCRSITRLIDKQLICNGNTETLGKFLSKNSIILWLFKTYHPNRKKFGAAFDNMKATPHITLHRFRHPRETERFLKDIA